MRALALAAAAGVFVFADLRSKVREHRVAWQVDRAWEGAGEANHGAVGVLLAGAGKRIDRGLDLRPPGRAAGLVPDRLAPGGSELGRVCGPILPRRRGEGRCVCVFAHHGVAWRVGLRRRGARAAEAHECGHGRPGRARGRSSPGAGGACRCRSRRAACRRLRIGREDRLLSMGSVDAGGNLRSGAFAHGLVTLPGDGRTADLRVVLHRDRCYQDG